MPARRLPASFASWAVAGSLIAWALLSMASIGIYILPGALIVLVLVASTYSVNAGSFGFVAGIGAAFLVVASRSMGEAAGSCDGPVVLGPAQNTSVSCGGISATPWLIAAAVALAVALAGFLVAQRRSHGR